MNIKERVNETYLVPVVVMDDASRAVDTANAMLAGGVDIMEITLRTPAGLDSIGKVAKNCPDTLVGAGTVLTMEQCEKAVERGARFIVSPGYDPQIVSYCVENKIMIMPGCVTPTEITAAMNMGLDVIKFFPANVYGGISAIKALAGPFPDIRFVPTGGVGLTNLCEFVHPSVFAIGGGWLCDRKAVNAGDYTAVTDICRKSVEIVKKHRG